MRPRQKMFALHEGCRVFKAEAFPKTFPRFTALDIARFTAVELHFRRGQTLLLRNLMVLKENFDESRRPNIINFRAKAANLAQHLR